MGIVLLISEKKSFVRKGLNTKLGLFDRLHTDFHPVIVKTKLKRLKLRFKFSNDVGSCFN